MNLPDIQHNRLSFRYVVSFAANSDTAIIQWENYELEVISCLKSSEVGIKPFVKLFSYLKPLSPNSALTSYLTYFYLVVHRVR